MIHSTKKAFTLVELVVVVTILSILASFGFLYLSANIKDSRDAARISDLGSIEKALEIYEIKNGNYPLPDNYVEVTYDDSTLWYQGTFWDETFREIRRLSNKPVDPLSKNEYSYSVLHNKREYEVSTVFEWNYLSQIPGIATANAKNNKAYLIGNYNKKFTSIIKWRVKTILALPSITSSDLSTPTLESIMQNNNIVINWQENLPASYNESEYNQSGNDIFTSDNYVLFHWIGTNLKSAKQQKAFIENIQTAYAQHPDLETDRKYQEVMQIDTNNPSQVQAYIQKIDNQNIGWVKIQ